MKMFQATLWIYNQALTKSFQCVIKNWVVSFAPLAYGLILSAVATLIAPFGLIGGVLLALATQACLSSGLYLLDNLVRIGAANFADFIKGFTVYLWELVWISFILWIPMTLAASVLAAVPDGRLLLALIQLTLYIVLNPVPEFIYQSRTSGLELLSASYNFIVENWIEWFLPNILLTVAGLFLLDALQMMIYPLPPFVQFFALAFGFGLYLTYFMAFRGFLFAELHGSTRRSRVFRYKARNS